ncbi:MAG TPA: hypothetical protein VJL89_08505 [Thermodesulfovibrionia bacterium]|nr:hypothetical protein [Thermodesulfovibrionia bacterium]
MNLFVNIAIATICIIVFFGCGEKKTSLEPKYHYPYSYKEGEFSCSLEEAVESAFRKEIYAAPYEAVRTAAMEILSQRGAIARADSAESHMMIVVSHFKFGTFYNSLVAVGLVKNDDKSTQITVSWIDPKNSICHNLMRSKAELEKSKGESLAPLEIRQYDAVMFGKEFLEQLSAKLFGLERWRKKFWKT